MNRELANTENDAAHRRGRSRHAQTNEYEASLRHTDNLNSLSWTSHLTMHAPLWFMAAASIAFFAPSTPSLLHPIFSTRTLTRTSASAPPVASTPQGCTSALNTGSFLPASPPCHVICGVVIFIVLGGVEEGE